jgi:hypothetical protein
MLCKKPWHERRDTLRADQPGWCWSGCAVPVPGVRASSGCREWMRRERQSARGNVQRVRIGRTATGVNMRVLRGQNPARQSGGFLDGTPILCRMASVLSPMFISKKTCHPCISKESTFVQETVEVGELRHRLPRGRTAPVHPVVISTGAQLRDRCPSHARPDSRKTSHRTYKAGYRDPSHLWSGYFIAIVRRAHQP